MEISCDWKKKSLDSVCIQLKVHVICRRISVPIINRIVIHQIEK